jgi:hypothetical protein
MPYAETGSIIDSWALRRGMPILEEDNKTRRKFFYTSSPTAETFQVVIEPEQNGAVRIDAHLIETSSEAEIHYTWEIPIQELAKTLDICMNTTRLWFDSQKR